MNKNKLSLTYKIINPLDFYKTNEMVSEALGKLSPYAACLLFLFWGIEAQEHPDSPQTLARVTHYFAESLSNINKAFFFDNLENQSEVCMEWMEELSNKKFIEIRGEKYEPK